MTRRGIVAKVCTNTFPSSLTMSHRAHARETRPALRGQTHYGCPIVSPIDEQIHTPTEKFSWMVVMPWRLLRGSSARACEAFNCRCSTASFGAPPPLPRMDRRGRSSRSVVLFSALRAITERHRPDVARHEQHSKNDCRRDYVGRCVLGPHRAREGWHEKQGPSFRRYTN
jgi:hypothetical protein